MVAIPPIFRRPVMKLPIILSVAILGILVVALSLDTSVESDNKHHPSSDSVSGNQVDSANQAESELSLGPDRMLQVAVPREILRRIQPQSIEYFPGESAILLELYKGNIGSVNVSDIRNGSAESIVSLFKALAPITGADSNLKLEIEQLLENGGNYVVDFRQVIDGTPVDRLQKINFDSTGTVTRLSSALIKASVVDATVEVLEVEAIVHARQAVVNEIGASDAEAKILSGTDSPESSQLLYRFVGLDGVPTKIWKFDVASTNGAPNYRVIVDALTGETRVFHNAHFWDTRVCENSDPQEEDCDPSSSSVTEIWSEDATGNAVFHQQF